MSWTGFGHYRNRAYTARYKKWLAALALAIAVGGVYWEVRGHSFVNYDDDLYVTGNPRVQSGLNWRDFRWALTTNDTGNWFPLTWTSHMLDCQFYGLNPTGHHLTNLGIHLANVLLLFFLLEWITGSFWRSAFVAMLFGIHPLNVESVAWVAERKNLLAGLFCLLTIFAYSWYALKPGFKRYILVLVSFLLAAMSKPTAVTLPLALLLLDYWPLGRLRLEPAASVDRDIPSVDDRTHRSFVSASLSKLLIEKIPLILVSAVQSVITVIVQRQGRNMPAAELFPLGVRIQNALVSYVQYLLKTIWPARLAVFYPHLGSHVPGYKVLIAVLFLSSVTSLAIVFVRRKKYLAMGWFWYLGALVPVIGIVQVGGQSIADRYIYLPLIGIFILSVWGVNELVKQSATIRTTAVMLGASAATFLMILTRLQLGYWTDSKALFEHALQVTEDNYVAYNNLGQVLASQGKTDEAAALFSRALEIDAGLESAHLNLGTVLVQQGHIDEGVEHFNQGLLLNPDSYDACNRLGAAFLRKGDLDRATQCLNRALEIKPDYAPALADLGIVQSTRGNGDEAIASFEKGLQLASGQDMAIQMRYWLAKLFLQKGMKNEAADQYRQILKLKPDLDSARNALRDTEGQSN